MSEHKSIDRQLEALEARLATAEPEERQRLLLKRERLQERSFKAWQKARKAKQ